MNPIASILDRYPALVIDGDVLTGFNSMEELETRIKESFELQEKEPAEAEVENVN